MGSLEVTVARGGAWYVTTSSGAVFILRDVDGALGVRTPEGPLAVLPSTSNAVELAVR